MPYNRNKLEYRSKLCVFIGYNNLHRGYKCLHLPTQRLYISRDVQFDESVYPFASSQPSPSPPNNHTSPAPIMLPLPVTSTQVHPLNQTSHYTQPPPVPQLPPSPLLATLILLTPPSTQPTQSLPTTDDTPSHTPPISFTNSSPSPSPLANSPNLSLPCSSSTRTSTLHDQVPCNTLASLDLASQTRRPITCSVKGISKPKTRTDGTHAWLSMCLPKLTANLKIEPHNYLPALRFLTGGLRWN